MLIYIRLIQPVRVKEREAYKVNLQETQHAALAACCSLSCGNPAPHDAVILGEEALEQSR